MQFCDIRINDSILSGEKIGELTKYIINKFADEKLTRDEAVEVLKSAIEVVGEVSVVNRIADSIAAPAVKSTVISSL